MIDATYVTDITDEALEALADAFLAPNEKERDLIIMHYDTGHTLKITSEMIHMSYINAKVIHKKALNKLRLAMEA